MNTENNQEKQKAIGLRLQQAREALGLSQKFVAEHLRLKLTTVRELEEGRLPADLAPTFFRGYVRAYARLVNLPEEEVLPEQSTEVMTIQQLPKVQSYSLTRRRKRRDGWLMTLTWLILFIIVSFTGAWWWQSYKARQNDLSRLETASPAVTEPPHNTVPLNENGAALPDNAPLATNRPAETAAPATEAPASSPNQTEAPAAAETQTDNNANGAVSPGLAAGSAPLTENVGRTGVLAFSRSGAKPVTPAEQDASDSASAQQSEDAKAIEMSFSADCWLEVSDGQGRKRFSGLKRAGDTLALDGQAPFYLKIGAPAAVTLRYQGKPVDLSRYRERNQVARLTLGGQG